MGRDRLDEAVVDRQGLDGPAAPRADRPADAALDGQVADGPLDDQRRRSQRQAVQGRGEHCRRGLPRSGGPGVEGAQPQPYGVEIACQHDVAALQVEPLDGQARARAADDPPAGVRQGPSHHGALPVGRGQDYCGASRDGQVSGQAGIGAGIRHCDGRIAGDRRHGRLQAGPARDQRLRRRRHERIGQDARVVPAGADLGGEAEMIGHPDRPCRRRAEEAEPPGFRVDVQLGGVQHVRIVSGPKADGEGVRIELVHRYGPQGPPHRGRQPPFVRRHPVFAKVAAGPRGRGEQGCLSPAGVEGELARTSGPLHWRRALDGEAVQPPDKDAELGNVVPAGGLAAPAEVGGMGELVEGARRVGGAVDIAQVRVTAGRCPRESSDQALDHGWARRRGRVAAGDRPDRRIELMTRTAQAPEELHRARVAPGDVGGQFLQQAECAAAAPVIDRPRHVQPLAPRVQAADHPRRQELADIGDHPVVAGLYRLVFPQPVDAAPDHSGLLADAPDQFAQRPVVHAWTGRIEGPIDRWQEPPELLGVPADIAVVRHRR